MTINVTDGLQHRWPLKNPNFEDTIQGNNLSLQSSGYQIIPGSQGGIFSSTGAYVSGPQDNTYFSPDGFTLSIFFRRDNGNPNKGLIGTFSDNNGNSWLLWADGQRSGEISFLIDDENNTRYQIQPNDRYNDGRFHHCVVVIDGSTVKMFVDGDEKGSADISSASFSDPLPNKPIYISAYDDKYQLDGDFYDARIYDRALSQPERQAIRDYHNRSSANNLYKNLKCLARMEQLPAKSSTPHIDSFTTHGTPQVVSGFIGNAVDFDGGSDHLVADNSIALGNNQTVAMWVKTDDTNDCQLYNGNGGANQSQANIEVNNGNYRGRAYDGTSTVGVVEGPAVDTSKYVHLAYRYDFDAGEAEFFVDGVSQGVSTNLGTGIAGDSSPSIAAHPNAGSNANAKIDEVYVYDEAISDSHIQRLVEQRTRQVQQL